MAVNTGKIVLSDFIYLYIGFINSFDQYISTDYNYPFYYSVS